MKIINTLRVGLRVASLVFALVCLTEVALLSANTDLRIGESEVRLWVGVAAVVGSGLLALWLWLLARHTKQYPRPPAH